MTEKFMQADAVIFLAAFILSVALVAITVKVCRHRGWVAKPRSDRWHKGTPGLFGGVPIWLTCLGLCFTVIPFSDHTAWLLLAASSLIFLLGLADDILHLRPRTKLAIEFLAASAIVASGAVYPLQHNYSVNFAVSVLWIVGITNAFNLLDNMDGLTAGIALISAAYLAIFYGGAALRDYNLLAIVASGAAAGFLLFNSNPARIFMGDCGSLFLGFLLGTLSLLDVTHISGVPALVLAPVVVLAIPVFDTVFVSVTRRLRGQQVSQGGTDHSSHRLVQLGLNERNAVLFLYLLSLASGAVALAARHIFYSHAIGLIGFWFLFLLLFGIHLFRADPATATGSHAVSVSRHEPVATNFLRRLFARDALILLLDPVALSLSYYLAYFLRFRAVVPRDDLELFLWSWPLVLVLKFAGLWICRVYRRSWWRGSISDSYRLAKATLAGEAMTVLLLIAGYRFTGFSRIVFVLDAAFSWALLLAIRQSFLLFHNSLEALSLANNKVRRVFVLGTSEHTELALRYLRGQRIACVGLIDTNGGADLGRWVWGIKVLGGLDDLSRLHQNHGVSEIVLPVDETLPCSDTEFRARCEQACMRLLKLGLHPAESPAVIETAAHKKPRLAEFALNSDKSPH